MLKFWIIVVYIKDVSAMDGEYPSVYATKVYTNKSDAVADYNVLTGSKKQENVIRYELVECISNKILLDSTKV